MRPLPRSFAWLGRHRPGSDQGLGIALLLAAVFTFTLMDSTAKYLTQFYHPIQVVWARFAGNLILLIALFRSHFLARARSRQPGLQLLRGAGQIAAILLFFTSLQHIGLAEATAIMDTNPVLITLGAALFLGESIGPRRIIGIIAALLGALLIIRPGASVFQPAAVLPMIGAFAYAAGALLTRAVRFDSTATSVAWSALMGTVVMSVAVPTIWQTPQWAHLWAFIAIGALGAVSQAMLIRAFTLAEAGALAPFGYTALVWAGMWGWLFFDQIPDRWTIAGASIIVAAGLYIWSREARSAGSDHDRH